MHRFIKKNINTILSLFILIQPILDLITGIGLHMSNLNLTLGITVRMLFLIFIVYICIFVYKKKKTLLYYLAIFLYFIMYVLSIYFFKDGVGLFSEIQGFIRGFYFPLVLVSLYQIKDEIRISNMTLFTSLFIYLVLIFVPLIFNQGFKTYQITKAGTLGFFNSANEISGIISILTPIMFIILSTKKNVILKLLLCIIFSVVILMIGTKTPLLSLIITLMVAIVWITIKSIKQKKYKVVFPIIIITLIGSISLILVAPKTNFYKNIKIHLDYLKLDSVLDVFEDKKLIDHFIFSRRLTFLEKKSKIYNNSDTYQKLFGIGYLKNNNHKTIKAIEMDYFDIYYSHGLIGFILFFSVYLYVLFDIFKNKFSSKYDKVMTYLSLFLIMVLSLFTGHIITAPAVSIIAVVILLNLVKKDKKDLLFTSYSLGVGGIESALINLLDRINYDKYNVCLVLEKKEGAFLSRINKNVVVKEFRVSENKNVILRKLINYTKRIMFTILNYKNYDFSCCYATYSYSGNKLSKISSSNNSIYVHSNYRYLYNEEEFREFFDNRNIDEFKNILFVSNESKNDFLKTYPKLINKTKVFNNFVDISKIEKLSVEKTLEKKPKNKKLFVYVGRLDDSSKKLSRLIDIADKIDEVEVWIIGSGPDKEMYEEEVKEKKLEKKVKFFGLKSNPYPYMKNSDYVILTSDYEGFPVTFLEAIVLNKNIITTIDVSDDYIKISDYASIISKDDKMIKQVKDILKKDKKTKEINLEEIQEKRIKELEKIFDEVV